MPDNLGNPLPGEPGYVPANQSGGLINATPATPPSSILNGTTQAPVGGSTLQNPSASAPPAVAAAASSVPVTPFTVASNQTVQSNVKDIVAADSPLMQQANARAMAAMNARGLLNSSQAISAGQDAVLSAALPIASADAATYDRAATNTSQAANTSALQTAQLATGVSQSNAGAVNTANLTAFQAELQKNLQAGQITSNQAITQMQITSQQELQKAQNDTSLSIADKNAAQSKYNADLASTTQLQNTTLSGNFSVAIQKATADEQTSLQATQSATQTKLATVQANFQTLMQTSASAANLYSSTMTGINAVVADATIPAANKSSLINGYIGNMETAMNAIGSVNGVDLSGLLNFATTSAQ